MKKAEDVYQDTALAGYSVIGVEERKNFERKEGRRKEKKHGRRG